LNHAPSPPFFLLSLEKPMAEQLLGAGRTFTLSLRFCPNTNTCCVACSLRSQFSSEVFRDSFFWGSFSYKKTQNIVTKTQWHISSDG
jgi:hypothetical protein